MGSHPEHEHRRAAGIRGLGFVLLAPIVVWAAHLTAAYTLIALDCYYAILSFTTLGLEGARFSLLLLTLAGVAVVVVCGLMALVRLGSTDRHADRAGVYRFLYTSAAILAAIFLLGMLWTLAPVLLVEQC